MVTNADMGKTTAIDGTTPLSPNAVASPCGLIAYTHFTDVLNLYKGFSKIFQIMIIFLGST
jgi:hypothetical protein